MKYCTILYLSNFIALVSVFCNAEQKAVNGGIVDGVGNEHFYQETPVELVQSIGHGRTLNKATTKATKQPKNNAKSYAKSNAKATKKPKNSKNPGTPSPTSTASLAPTGSPTVAPTVAPTSTASPSVLPTMSPTTSPSAFPTMSPSTVPTLTTSPTGIPTMVPSSYPSVLPTMSPTTGPSATPTMSPSTVHTLTPSSVPTKKTATNSPTTRPSSASTLCIHDESNPIRFKPIKDDGGVLPDFYYNLYDDYGYTDDGDDDTEENNQIPNIDDFRLEENGRMSFLYPWGCTPDATLDRDPACHKATLEIFEEDSANPLEGDSKVFLKENTDDGSLIVSWERVQGKKIKNGDVNVQAQLFTDGNIRVCFGCGSLPVDLNMSMRFDSDEARYYYEDYYFDGPNPDVSFGPTDNSVYPENECFNVPLD